MNPIEFITKNKIYAVVRAETPDEVVKIAEAIIRGGIKAIEVTVEKGALLPAVKELSKNKDIVVTAGGIITAKRAQEAIDNGADIIVSPVLQNGLIKYCVGAGVPHIATVTTQNEAYMAWRARIPLIKISPAKSMGQVTYLEDLLRPMPFLNLMPAGGITHETFADYLKAGAAAVALGRCLYRDITVEETERRAAFAVETLKNL